MKLSTYNQIATTMPNKIMNPILFSTAMVQAIISGNKTQTRRKVPAKVVDAYYDYDDWASSVGKPEGISCTRTYEKEYFMNRCKYSIRDILWVRETWRPIEQDFSNPRYEYKATETINITDKWKPSIFMPKRACRLFLEVTDVRAERLHDIKEEDAIAEGVGRWVEERMKSKPTHYQLYYTEPGDDSMYSSCPILSYESLWKKINGVESWEENPWVYVVTFKKI